jgi:hypothetical protein
MTTLIGKMTPAADLPAAGVIFILQLSSITSNWSAYSSDSEQNYSKNNRV